MEDWRAVLAEFGGVALALALGLLIGVERGWSQRLEPDGSRVAGIRTFALLGLVGGLAGVLGERLSPAAAAVLLAGAAAAILIGYAQSAERGEVSATTAVGGLVTLALGVLAAIGQLVVASVAAALTTLLLSQRQVLHHWIRRLTEAELHAIARFGLLSLAILPLLPDVDLGPYHAWNPRGLWMVVVFVSGLSLLGYAASRILGDSRGILATAAAGALVSSTAVTAALAARLRRGEGAAAVMVAGIALASAVMLLRVLALVAILAPFAFPTFAAIVGPAAAVGVLWAIWGLARSMARGEPPGEPAPLSNPFDLKPAFILVALVMVVAVLGRWALHAFGDAGLAAVLAISGVLDVDSAIISLAGLPPGSLTPTVAGLALAAPLLANSLLKAGMTVVIAGGRGGWLAAGSILLCIAAAAIPAAAILANLR